MLKLLPKPVKTVNFVHRGEKYFRAAPQYKFKFFFFKLKKQAPIEITEKNDYKTAINWILTQAIETWQIIASNAKLTVTQECKSEGWTWTYLWASWAKSRMTPVASCRWSRMTGCTRHCPGSPGCCWHCCWCSGCLERRPLVHLHGGKRTSSEWLWATRNYYGSASRKDNVNWRGGRRGSLKALWPVNKCHKTWFFLWSLQHLP